MRNFITELIKDKKIMHTTRILFQTIRFCFKEKIVFIILYI